MNIEITFSNAKDFLLINADIPKGVSIITPIPAFEKAYGEEFAVTVLVSIATGVSTGLVANWLYDKLKHNRSRHISINRRQIDFSKGEVVKTIEETINIKE